MGNRDNSKGGCACGKGTIRSARAAHVSGGLRRDAAARVPRVPFGAADRVKQPGPRRAVVAERRLLEEAVEAELGRRPELKLDAPYRFDLAKKLGKKEQFSRRNEELERAAGFTSSRKRQRNECG